VPVNTGWKEHGRKKAGENRVSEAREFMELDRGVKLDCLRGHTGGKWKLGVGSLVIFIAISV
jgi:hypothetical protein